MFRAELQAITTLDISTLRLVELICAGDGKFDRFHVIRQTVRAVTAKIVVMPIIINIQLSIDMP